MTKVFKLTILPATRWHKTVMALSIAPGVPLAMRVRAFESLDAAAKRLGAEWFAVEDCEVEVASTASPGRWARVLAWMARRRAEVKG